MTQKQPEALRLADVLEAMNGPQNKPEYDAAVELRRLHEENKLLHERHSFNNKFLKQLEEINAELLEALKGMARLYPPNGKARAAITKAEAAK